MSPTKVVQLAMLLENPMLHRYYLNKKKKTSSSSQDEPVSWYLW